jgi:hypothetical protein
MYPLQREGRYRVKTTIIKCDRCKKKVEAVVNIVMVNRNVTLEDEPSNNHFLLLGPVKRHPTIEKEVCESCVMELCRWVEHEENFLLSSAYGGTK